MEGGSVGGPHPALTHSLLLIVVVSPVSLLPRARPSSLLRLCPVSPPAPHSQPEPEPASESNVTQTERADGKQGFRALGQRVSSKCSTLTRRPKTRRRGAQKGLHPPTAEGVKQAGLATKAMVKTSSTLYDCEDIDNDG